jgi:hypothetical protein
MIQRTVVLSALWILGIAAAFLPALACRSGAPGGGEEAPAAKTPAAREAPPVAAPRAPPPGSPAPGTTAQPSEAAVPSSGRAQPAPAAEPAPAAAPSGPERILATTRRSAAGLPDSLSGYTSWFRLGASPSPDQAAGAHAPARQAYVLFPKPEQHALGDAVKAPLEQGTIIVLEEKAPGQDFIARIRTMAAGEAGWKFEEYAREAGDKAFAARAGTEAQCAACHAKASGSGSVYAKLTLE